MTYADDDSHNIWLAMHIFYVCEHLGHFLLDKDSFKSSFCFQIPQVTFMAIELEQNEYLKSIKTFSISKQKREWAEKCKNYEIRFSKSSFCFWKEFEIPQFTLMVIGLE